MAADDVDGQNAAAFRWRWVDAVRYLVALAVTALMVTVIAYAVHVLLRPDVLDLRVDKGFVAVEPGTPAWNRSFSLVLEVANPSGRVAIYYEDVRVFLYGRANNASEAKLFATMRPQDSISLNPQSTKFVSLLSFPPLNSPKYNYKAYFDLFNSSGTRGIPDGVVVVNGTLTVALYSLHNQTSKAATYYCWPVAIGGVPSDDNTAGGAQCMDNPPTPAAKLPGS